MAGRRWELLRYGMVVVNGYGDGKLMVVRMLNDDASNVYSW